MEDSAHNSLPEPHPIEVEFFSKRSNKTTKLVNSKQGFAIEGAHRWYEFEFKEPVYLTEIQVECVGYDSWNKFEVEVYHVDGTVHEERISVEANTISLALGKLVKGFRFRPDSRWLTKTQVLRVVATGYSLKEFHEFEWHIKEIRKKEAAIASKEAKASELAQNVRSHESQIKSLTADIGKLTAERAQLQEQLSTSQAELEKKAADDKDLKREIEVLREERRNLRADISADEKTLESLTTELRLFPSEIAGFVEEGNRNIKTYLALSAPFALILLFVLYSLFSSAIDLTQLWKVEEGIDIWTIFLTRIPFVLVAIALIEACGFIVGRLIFEIVRINRQRLEFSKLSIIAKDVVTATASGTEMDTEAVFVEEMKLKMSLLQEYMKSQSAEEFKYHGSAITSAVIGLANRFSRKSGAGDVDG